MSIAISSQFMQQLIQEIENRSLTLPGWPIATKVCDAVADENASASERLIQLTNHPLIGAALEVDSLEKAVKHLGMVAVQDLVFILVREQMFHAGTELIDKNLGQLWEHSTPVSAISHDAYRKIHPTFNTCGRC